jgi:hypothetical protein
VITAVDFAEWINIYRSSRTTLKYLTASVRWIRSCIRARLGVCKTDPGDLSRKRQAAIVT